MGTASVGTDSEPPDDSRTLRNQFNFSDRAAQTAVQPPRDRGTTTEPPPTASTAGSCSMWQVGDRLLDLEHCIFEELQIPALCGKLTSASASKSVGVKGCCLMAMACSMGQAGRCFCKG